MSTLGENSESSLQINTNKQQYLELYRKFSQLRPNQLRNIKTSPDDDSRTMDPDNSYTNDVIYNKPNCYEVQIPKRVDFTVYDEQKFVEAAKENWNDIQKSDFELPAQVLGEINALWKNKQAMVFNYPQLYMKKGHVSLSTTGPTDTGIHFEKMKSLQEGEAERIIKLPPNRKYFTSKKKPQYNTLILPPIIVEEEKQRIAVVSEDKIIDKFVQDKEVTVVISSSGLKTLLDNYAYETSEWTLPFCIKSIKNSDGSKKNVLYVDKALPRTDMSIIQQKHWHVKKAVYEFLCNPERQSEVDLQNVFNNIMSGDESELDSASNVEEPKPMDHSEFANKEVKNDTNCKENLYSYALWKLSDLSSKNLILKNTKKDFTLIVRSKNPVHKENDIEKKFCISSKLEYQPHFGGEHMSRSELTREWVSLRLNPNSFLIRVRVEASDLSYIQYDIGSIDWIEKNMMAVYEERMSKQLYLLQNVLTQLTEMPVGQYILQRTYAVGAFAMIYQASNNKVDFNLHNYFNELRVRKEKLPWIKIDFALISKRFRIKSTAVTTTQAGHKLKKKKKKKKKKKGAANKLSPN